jgi:hypothetical protein
MFRCISYCFLLNYFCAYGYRSELPCTIPNCYKLKWLNEVKYKRYLNILVKQLFINPFSFSLIDFSYFLGLAIMPVRCNGKNYRFSTCVPKFISNNNHLSKYIKLWTLAILSMQKSDLKYEPLFNSQYPSPHYKFKYELYLKLSSVVETHQDLDWREWFVYIIVHTQTLVHWQMGSASHAHQSSHNNTIYCRRDLFS